MTKLGEVITARLAETGWTLAQLSERSGLSVSTLCALRMGTRGKRPRTDTLEKLARGLDLPRERLLELVRDAGGRSRTRVGPTRTLT